MLTILNQKALGQVIEQHLRFSDPEEVKQVIANTRNINALGTGGYMKGRQFRARGDILNEPYWRVIRRFPAGSKEREQAKREYFKIFSKSAIESKSKYI